jgi:UDP-glucose 4-epimerase
LKPSRHDRPRLIVYRVHRGRASSWWSFIVADYTVTGGAGFIGSHLTDALLAAGHTVRVLDDLSTGRIENLDRRCQLIRGSVTDPETVRRALHGVDGCFHLAAVASVARANEDWTGTHRVNVTGTVTVLDAARAAGGMPVIYTSSAAVYGDCGTAPAHEDQPANPMTAYGADKFGSELHARVGLLMHKLSTIGLRPFNVYGPRQDPSSPYSGVISIFARRIADDLPVNVHGDGRQTRDFVFVADVVAHFVAAMRRLESGQDGGVFNVCTGTATSLLDLVQLLGEQYGRTPRLVFGPARAGDIRQSRGDPTRAIAALGVRATTRLADGIADTLASLERAAA